MGIPEAQLETWSHQGAIAQSSDTYNVVRNVLRANGVPYSDKGYEIFLQGSYGNDTNIWRESDVDIVINLTSTFYSDLSEVSPEQQVAQQAHYANATYGYTQFKRDVLAVLRAAYGVDVAEGDKAIAIAARGNRRKCDVIVACQYRRYHRFVSEDDQRYDEGICFWNRADEQIANYPKQHSANLTTKHQASLGGLKPMIRIMKSIRTRCVDDGLLAAGVAPSYFIEGLLYNVPPEKLMGSFEGCFVNAINWIQSEAVANDLLCANEQYYLIRNDSHNCWPTADFDAFVEAAIQLWNEW